MNGMRHMQVTVICRSFLAPLAALLFTACGTQITPPVQISQNPPESPANSQQTEQRAAQDKAAADEVKHADLSPELLYQLMLAEVAGQRGKLDVAVYHYLEAARVSNDPKIIERATRIAVYARDSESALEAASMWVKVDPENFEAHQVAAAMHLRAGNTEAAQHHLEQIITLRGDGTQNTFMLITSLLSKERDKQRALDVMEQLIETRQDNPEALYAYSQLALLVGDLNKAEKAAKRVLDLKADWIQAHILYNNILHRQGKTTEALRRLSQALEDYPDSVVLRDFYARRLVDEKQYDEAQKQFQILLEKSPDNTEAMYALGILTIHTKDLDTAEKHFSGLLQRGSRINEASYYLGQIEEQRGNIEAAIDHYSLVNDGQYLIEAQIRIAMLEARIGSLNDGRNRLRSINAPTADIEQRLFLAEGEMLRNAQMHQAAFDLYSEALAKMPNNISLLYARALTAEKVERVDVTISDLELILQSEPNNAQALNALGYTLVDRTARLKEGLAYIEKAYQLKPDDPAILDSMGWANYRLGRHEEALKYLKQAIAKLNDAEIAAHLGEVLWVMGEQEEARRVWDEAIRTTPSHKLLLDVIKRFTQ